MEKLRDLEITLLRHPTEEEKQTAIDIAQNTKINGQDFCNVMSPKSQAYEKDIDVCFDVDDPNEVASCVSFTRHKHEEYSKVNNLYKESCL